VLRLGLTGGIGSGKSTVASFLKKWGAAVMDADVISRNLTAAGGLAIPEITRVFGAGFITPEGALDRTVMRDLVFADHGAKKKLEAILHPRVGAEIAWRADAAFSTGSPCLVYDIPLLVESPHWRNKVDHVLVIDCSHEVQIARVRARSGLDAAAIESIIAGQATRRERLQAADSVICNELVGIRELESLAAQLWQWPAPASPVSHRNLA
jgi:dephospho-CoA kinase